MIDIGGHEAGRVEGRTHRLRAKVKSCGNPGVIARAKRGQSAVLLHRNGKVTPTHTDRPVKLLEAFDIEVLSCPLVAQGRNQGFLIGKMWRECAGDGANSGGGHGARNLARTPAVPTATFVHRRRPYTTVPKRRPTNAVATIATTPQNATRAAPRTIGAPPRRAASKPSPKRSTSDTPITT